MNKKSLLSPAALSLLALFNFADTAPNRPAAPKKMGAGAYGRGLTTAFNRSRRSSVKPTRTDEYGAYTEVGRSPRRKWLAGVSAMRGY